MTAPTIAAPAAPVTAPPARPAGYGLLAAATVAGPGGPRPNLMAGVEWEPAPCRPALPYPVPCTDDNTPLPARTFYDAEQRNISAPFGVYWGTECGAIGADRTDATVRAGLAQGEGRAVEAQVWALLDSAEDFGAARGLVDALGHLEEELGSRLGALGLIHAPRRVAAHAAAYNLVRYEGAVPRTPGGHAWVFGSGYDPARGNPPQDGVRLVATGPFMLWRDEVSTIGPLFDSARNRWIGLAERTYVAGWDCAALSMTLPLSP